MPSALLYTPLMPKDGQEKVWPPAVDDRIREIPGSIYLAPNAPFGLTAAQTILTWVHITVGGWPSLMILSSRTIEICKCCCSRKSSYSPSSKIKSGRCLPETAHFILQRKEEQWNVIYMHLTGICGHLGFGISNGLGNFEGETIKEITSLQAQTEASIREQS